ncbi:TetR/AcrR family transcriptional regulator [Scytonema millei]|uniref:TetR/AcrR family transcriptional regulator n=1 Tax=Scytonema millei VB511283 TaxID=1245923 RepID=A0A9X5I6P9_9CYAN|nr:TetR/AcrR family transcriptional regulator [Scytonema millei]NHC37336.1 TetR/AcrR family transcriptional regulator [Scytonema millei VB511283]
MTSDGDSNTRSNHKSGNRKSGGMNAQRQQRVRLEISREAARLFWEHGVAATSGEQIASAVGISVRTLWRHFRNKESCAEPVLAQDVEEFVAVLRRWPREVSLEDHLVEWATNRPRDPDRQSYDEAVIKMTVLAEKEPDLRAAWLMTNDRIEREMAEIIADRLRRSADDIEVRLHAAAATAVLRVISEDVSAALMAGADRASIGNPIKHMAHAVRVATGGVVGDPVEPGKQ